MKVKTKICSKCNVEKDITKFYKAKRGKFGVHSICKICRNKYHKIFQQTNACKEQQKEYNKTHPWIRVFASINQRCNYKNHIRYNRYGGRGIQNLFKNSDEVKFLWNRDNAFSMKKPHIHRIDNNDAYYII
jgi:hypothetical protein